MFHTNQTGGYFFWYMKNETVLLSVNILWVLWVFLTSCEDFSDFMYGKYLFFFSFLLFL